MTEGLSRFARRASASPNSYVRGRQGATRAKATKVFGPFECSNVDPAGLANQINERLEALDPADGKCWVEVLEHNATSATDSSDTLCVDLAEPGTGGPTPATFGDGQVNRAFDALLRTNEMLGELAATAIAQATTAAGRSMDKADQRDEAIEALWKEKVARAKADGAKPDAEASTMSPMASRMLELGFGVVMSRLGLAPPRALPAPAPAPAPSSTPPPAEQAGGTPTPAAASGGVDLEAALDQGISLILEVTEIDPSLITVERVQRLEPLLARVMSVLGLPSMAAPS